MIILYDILHEYKKFTGNANNAKVMGLVSRENTSLVAKMAQNGSGVWENIQNRFCNKPLQT